jgi:response regulator NasT
MNTSSETQATPRRRVLLVDDDRLVLATLQRGLAAMGYAVEVCDNGREALERHRQTPADIVILDIRMPDMSGLELARAMLQAVYRPILMLSAHDDGLIVGEAIALGVSGYLVKPIEVNQLIPSIEAALARFAEVSALMKDSASLREGVERNRVISTAVGIVMERAGLTADMAFESLRKLARDQRRALRDVAQDLVNAIAVANSVARK